MHIDSPSRQSLLRYLLNELDEAERERVDTLLLTDAEYEAQFQEVQYDLLDALAAGELNAEDAARVKRALQPDDRFSPVRHGSQHRSKATVVAIPQAPISDVKRSTRTGVPIYRLAAAALVLIGVALGMGRLLMHRRSTAQEVSIVAPEAPAKATGAQAGREVAQPSAASKQPQPEHATVFAVLLLPGATRSSNALHLPISHGADSVRIDWPAPADALAARYQLQVLNDSGKTTCTAPGNTRRSANGSVVRFVCAARDIPPGIDFVRIASLPADPELPSLLEATVSVEKNR